MGIFTKNFIWPFSCILRVVLFITTYFGHSTTKNSLKYQIWNFAFWVDKMSQNRAIFFEIALEHCGILPQKFPKVCSGYFWYCFYKAALGKIFWLARVHCKHFFFIEYSGFAGIIPCLAPKAFRAVHTAIAVPSFAVHWLHLFCMHLL